MMKFILLIFVVCAFAGDIAGSTSPGIRLVPNDVKIGSRRSLLSEPGVHRSGPRPTQSGSNKKDHPHPVHSKMPMMPEKGKLAVEEAKPGKLTVDEAKPGKLTADEAKKAVENLMKLPRTVSAVEIVAKKPEEAQVNAKKNEPAKVEVAGKKPEPPKIEVAAIKLESPKVAGELKKPEAPKVIPLKKPIPAKTPAKVQAPVKVQPVVATVVPVKQTFPPGAVTYPAQVSTGSGSMTPKYNTRISKSTSKIPYPYEVRKKWQETYTHTILVDSIVVDSVTCTMTKAGYLWDWSGYGFWTYVTVAAYAEYESMPATLQKKVALMRMSRAVDNGDFKSALYPRIKDYKENGKVVVPDADFLIFKGLVEGVTANLAVGDSILFVYGKDNTLILHLNDVEKASTTALTLGQFNTILIPIRHYLTPTK